MGNVLDSIPIISQVKSAVEAASGDLEAARRTQEHFATLTPGVSQIKSAIEAAVGDPDRAKKTQEEFLQGITGIDVGDTIHIDGAQKDQALQNVKDARNAGEQSKAQIDSVLTLLAASDSWKDLKIDLTVTTCSALLSNLAKVQSYWDNLIHQVDTWLQEAQEYQREGVSFLRFLNVTFVSSAAFYEAIGLSSAARIEQTKRIGLTASQLVIQFQRLDKAILEAQAAGRSTLEEEQINSFGHFTSVFKEEAADLKDALEQLGKACDQLEAALQKA